MPNAMAATENWMMRLLKRLPGFRLDVHACGYHPGFTPPPWALDGPGTPGRDRPASAA